MRRGAAEMMCTLVCGAGTVGKNITFRRVVDTDGLLDILVGTVCGGGNSIDCVADTVAGACAFGRARCGDGWFSC